MILSVSAFLFPAEIVLYSILCALVTMLATNSVFHGLNERAAILIISEKAPDLADILTLKYRFGVTRLLGQGGYQDTRLIKPRMLLTT
nr:YitT family protein [Desulfobulbus alkaliphilus]